MMIFLKLLQVGPKLAEVEEGGVAGGGAHRLALEVAQPAPQPPVGVAAGGGPGRWSTPPSTCLGIPLPS